MSNIIECDSKEILRQVNLKKMRGKRVLITGVNGFLGQYIISAISLANREMKLKCKIDAVGFHKPRKIVESLLSKDKNITYKQVDLSKFFKLQGYDYIFHTAGYGQPAKFVVDPVSTIAINVNATARLLDTSPRATFVYFSSAEVYGDIPPKFIPVSEDFNGNSPLHNPRSVYAESKRLGEAICATYKREKGMNVKIVRISAVYGPGLSNDDTRVMSEFIRKALTEKEIKLLDAGRSVRTYGYIADVVSMILFTALYSQDMVYNVGGKDSISILDLAKKISKYCKVKYKIPAHASKLIHIGKDPAVVKLDLSKIKREMRNLLFTPFSKGLANTIEWSTEIS